MRSETNGLRAQTTTSPLGCEICNTRAFISTQRKKKKNTHKLPCLLFVGLRSPVVRVEPVLPWPCGAGARYCWRFLCGWVLGELVSRDMKLGRDVFMLLWAVRVVWGPETSQWSVFDLFNWRGNLIEQCVWKRPNSVFSVAEQKLCCRVKQGEHKVFRLGWACICSVQHTQTEIIFENTTT